MSVTISCLEIQAATLAVQSKSLIAQLNINISEYLIYPYSQIVVNCIRNIEKHFKPFVMHRLNKIRSMTILALKD